MKKRGRLAGVAAAIGVFACGLVLSGVFASPGTSRPLICPNPPCTTTIDPTDSTTTTTTTPTTTTTANQAPVARFTASPNPATVGQSITFNGSSSSDPEGHLTRYEWEFGDGVRTDGPVVTHAFGQAASWGVRLTVFDDVGNAGSTFGTVTVVAAPTTSTTTASTTTVTTTTTPTATTTTTTTPGPTTPGPTTPTTTNASTTSSVATTTTTQSTTTTTASLPPPASRQCIVPSVFAKTLAKARKLLRVRACGVGRVTTAKSRLPKGRVVSQRPVAGSILPAGTKVRLVLSRGSKRR